MSICDHRYRRLHTLAGPVQLVCKLNHCPDPHCPGHTKTKSPEIEATIAPPQWAIGWDVFCWIGHRRFARHWAVPQIQAELRDAYGIKLSDTAITAFTHWYQAMVATRQQDPEHLRRLYQVVDRIILTIDAIQPEKGHEALYVVRELTRKRVWFAEPLISATDDEVRRLIVTAKQWAQALGQTVTLWISDKQGDCSGWGRERREVAARAFYGLAGRAKGTTACPLHPHFMAAQQAAQETYIDAVALWGSVRGWRRPGGNSR